MVKSSKTITVLERNLFKNVSKGPAFLWQTQIQTIELPSMIRYKWKRKRFLVYTLWYEFSNDFDAQSEFSNNFVTEKAGLLS